MAILARERTKNHFVQGRVKSSRKSDGRKSTILGLLVMAVGLLVFLSLVSYDASDEAGADLGLADLLNVFSGDPDVRARADTAQNWLGLVGAVVADALIKGTVGYSVLCFPLLLTFLGWTFFRGESVRKTFVPISYATICAILASSSFGMVRSIFGLDVLGMQWSGIVGDFVATILSQLLGKAGASIVITTCILIFLILAADLDLRDIVDRIRSLLHQLVDWASRKKQAWSEQRENTHNEARPSVLSGSRIQVNVPSPGLEETRREFHDQARRNTQNLSENGEKDGGESRTPVGPGKEIRIEIEKREGDVEGSLNDTGDQVTVDEDLDYVFPSVELLDAPRASREDVDEEELKANADLLRDTLAEFDVELDSVSVTPGPVVTLYELVPAAGVKISRIVSLENDIALKLAAKGIRIMAPIPGKSAVGVEIPNHNRAIVTIRSVINSSAFRDTQANLPLAMGKTIFGEVFTDDLSKMPHILIAGSTGSGKSVGINTILVSLLYRMHPSDLKLVIIDPKKIELSQYAKLRQHFLAISPDIDEEIITSPRNAVLVLKGVEFEMEKRYDRLAAAGVRSIVDYNERVDSGRLKNTETLLHSKMPYLVVVIDELADLMITAAREVEEPVARLAQLARAVGIHLVVATQRPSVDVITGVIKANFSARIAYQVASKTDSRTILDMNGAEQLLGNGDMLYLASGSPKPVRLQNAFISAEEVDAVVAHITRQKGYAQPFLLPSITERKRAGGEAGSGERDELFEEAARLIVRHQQGSVSLLQRRLKVGYSRAARLVDDLEAAGIVGPYDGSKARDVLIESEVDLDSLFKRS